MAAIATAGHAPVFVGVGSNISAQRNIERACVLLNEAFGPLRISSVYRSAPVGFDGADFLNLVIALDSDAGPDAVETVLSSIEQASGRRRKGNGPDSSVSGSRTLDLDLLLYGRMVDPARRLPRADVLCYGFVLAPLAELAPQLRHPVTGQRIAEVWRERAPELPPLENVGSAGDFTSLRCDPRPPRESGR
jgi:2-amino-4-hydroxy-6-hydroxymethyldihydropteridine diphosphokinase